MERKYAKRKSDVGVEEKSITFWITKFEQWNVSEIDDMATFHTRNSTTNIMQFLYTLLTRYLIYFITNVIVVLFFLH